MTTRRPQSLRMGTGESLSRGPQGGQSGRRKTSWKECLGTGQVRQGELNGNGRWEAGCQVRFGKAETGIFRRRWLKGEACSTPSGPWWFFPNLSCHLWVPVKRFVLGRVMASRASQPYLPTGGWHGLIYAPPPPIPMLKPSSPESQNVTALAIKIFKEVIRSK